MADRAFGRRTRGATQLRLLLALFLLASMVLSGCASSSGAKSTPTPSSTATPPEYLLYLFDGNFASAKHVPDVRYSVVALDRRDGHRVWRHQLDGQPGNSAFANFQPIAQDGLVYVDFLASNAQTGSTQGILEALDPATGGTRWRHEVGNGLEGEPVISGGVVYLSAHIVMTQDGQYLQSGLVQALDARTGALRWQHVLDATPSMPAVSGSLVMVVFGSQAGAPAGSQMGAQVVALSAQDGTVRWDYASDAPLSRGDAANYEGSTAPLVLGQLVYARAPEDYLDGGSTHIVLVALHARDGSFAWQYDTGGVAATPTISPSGDTLCVSEYHINPTHTSTIGSVTGLSTSTGTVRWHVTGPARASACVAVGTVFYLSEQAPDLTSGDLVALGSQDGRQLWQTPTTKPEGPLNNIGLFPPAISDGLAVVCLQPALGSSNLYQTTIVAVGLGDGKLRWHVDVAGALTLPEIDGDQVVEREGVFGSGDALLVALALQTGARLWTYTLGRL